MREIVFDTETTGFSHKKGDRMIEIGCVEVENRIQTGRFFHRYMNPQRYISKHAIAVHGLTEQFLADKLLFKDIAEDLIEFLGDSNLIAHNAKFDIGFLNFELSNAGFAPLENKVIDTLTIAKEKFPGSPTSLDALCKRFKIDLNERKLEKHGGLLDAKLLSKVYLELFGGAQKNFSFDECIQKSEKSEKSYNYNDSFLKIEDSNCLYSEETEQSHRKLMEKIKNNLWYNN